MMMIMEMRDDYDDDDDVYDKNICSDIFLFSVMITFGGTKRILVAYLSLLAPTSVASIVMLMRTLMEILSDDDYHDVYGKDI